jgi:hypothetical protein
VLDGRRFDELFHGTLSLPKMPSLDIIDIIDRILSREWVTISSVDISSMFYQFRIHQSMRPFFHFRNSDGHFHMNALPMGICFAPAFAQHVSNYIVNLVKSNLAQFHFDAFAWIDNFIVVSLSPEADEQIRAAFDQTFLRLSLVTKPWEGGGNRLELLGLSFDLSTKTVYPTQRALTNLRKSMSTMRELPTVFHLLTWFGHAMWINYTVLRYPLCLRPTIMDTIRTACRAPQADWHSPCTFPHWSEADRWTEELTSASFTTPRRRTALDTLWTDVSCTGLAVMSIRTHRIFMIQ